MNNHGDSDDSMNVKVDVEGYIVDSFYRTKQGCFELFYICRLSDGRTCGIHETRFSPRFFIRIEDESRVQPFLSTFQLGLSTTTMKTMDGAGLRRVDFTGISSRKIMDAFHGAGIRTYEADLRPDYLFLMDHGVLAAVCIQGTPRQGRNVDIVFSDPAYQKSAWSGQLVILSMDIETAPDASEVYVIALCQRNAAGVIISEDVAIQGRPVTNGQVFDTEAELLNWFVERVRMLDPDVITGWNVIDFDISVLSQRFTHHGLPFNISRTGTPLKIVTAPSGRSTITRVIVEGRQVLDGLWLTRLSHSGLDNYKLETVARTYLGRGKSLNFSGEEDVPGKLRDLYESGPNELVAYCLEDARLVLDILEKGGFFDLIVQKSLSIGLPLSRVHMSIASFEHLYIRELHQRGIAAPSLGIDQVELWAVPGGGIIAPQPGYFRHVFVYDFKSLYPSLMRTFNLDPWAYIRAESDDDPIQAPNGARFARGDSPIGRILDELTVKREAAKKEKNKSASYAYKIIMNSFYGVLGTDGCRFSNPAIAGAITSFGQYFLRWTQQLLETWGYRVLYGDTDSLFVLSEGGDECSLSDMLGKGHELSRRINNSLVEHIQTTYGLHSKLEIEFEKYYRRFLLPEIRNRSGEDTGQRGRAKGYAGLIVEMGESDNDVISTLDVIGLESVRRDWTLLAGDLQRQLLDLLFHDRGPESLSSHIRQLSMELQAGNRDAHCVYRKALRKPVSAYVKSKPPHVRAAELLPPEQQKGVISYVVTMNGPEPSGYSSFNSISPLDYEHYREKQIRPIVHSLDQILHWDLEDALQEEVQFNLFKQFDL